MPNVHPCLWFDHEAEEAANFYVSVFPNSKVGRITRYGPAAAKASGRPKGSVMTVEFTLDGRPFMALNGGPPFKFTEAVSLCVPCRTQKEIDTYWAALTEGGSEVVCGWLKDKFGLSWQIFPAVLMKMHADPDARKRERVMAAMLKMTKMDVAKLKAAYAGR
jgi:predicted 3-demethylubiquinone-9 3-methyltransferase (glyoxalase superfamily)